MPPPEAAWLDAGVDEVAVWLHRPSPEQQCRSGVLICPGFGHDYAHGHRTLLRTAEALCRAGFPTLRIDYPGTGASSGDDTNPDLVDRWIASVDAAVEYLENLTGGERVSIVGLRLGATLAAKVAATRDVRHFVGWNPVVRGKRYVRELRALSGFSTAGPGASDDFLEAGGFRMSPATADAVGRLDLRGLDYRIRGEALVIERTDLPQAEAWQSTLSEQEITTSLFQQSDYLEMLAEPQFTVVPHELIDQMVDWLVERDDSEIAVLCPVPAPDRRVDEDGGYREELIRLADSDVRLFGVLTEPSRSLGETPPVVILPNAGSVHQVGPNRLYVELARSLAYAGFASFRLDLRNLGDSSSSGVASENHPYPPTAVEDLRIAMEWLGRERGAESFVVGGLCSGAYNSFRAGLELDQGPIVAVLPINPVTYRWRDGMTLDTPDPIHDARRTTYYRSAIRDRARWMRFLRGQSDWRSVARFVASRPARFLRHKTRKLLGALHLRRFGPLEKDLLELHRRGIAIRFVFSDNDPGLEILRSEAPNVVRRLRRTGSLDVFTIPDANHTFSRKQWRDAAIQGIVERLQELAGR